METFDLTTQEGKKSAKAFLLLMSPTTYIAYKIIKMVLDPDSGKKQAEAAESLIRAGKDNGVDEMEIVVDNTKGFKLDVPDDVKISTVLGSHEKMKIHVKYK